MGETVFYRPKYAEKMKNCIEPILNKGRELVKKYYNSDERIRTVSVRLIEKHITFTEFYARAIVAKASGMDDESARIFEDWKDHFGRLEYELRRYFDNFLFFRKAYGAFGKNAPRRHNATEI